MKKQRSVFACGFLALSVIFMVSCAKDPLNPSSHTTNPNQPVYSEGNEQEVLTTFSLSLSNEEIASIVIPLIDDLPNDETSILIIPDAEQGLATVYQGGEPDPDPDKHFVWGCDYDLPFDNVCHNITNYLIDSGCALSGYDSGTEYVYWADCP